MGTVQAAMAEDLLGIYRQALTGDAQYQAARYQHLATYQTLDQAYAELRPNLSFDYTYQYTDQSLTNRSSAFLEDIDQHFTTRSWNLTLSQPLFRYPAWLRVVQVKAELRLADAQLAAERQELMLRVADAYLTALGAQDEVTFALAEEEAIERQHLQAEKRYQAGMGRRTDLFDAKARLASVRAGVFTSNQRLDDARQALSELTGEPLRGPLAALDGERLRLESPEPAYVDEWIIRGRVTNPRLVARDLGVDVAGEEVRRQRAGHYPTLELVGRIRHVDNESTEVSEGGDDENREVLLRAVVPLYQGGVVVSRTDEAVALLSKSYADRDREMRRIERETRAAFLGVTSDIMRVAALAEAVAANELAVDAKRKGFEAGIYVIIAVLDAERDLYASKRDHARARYEYLLNHLRLKQAVGAVDDSDFERINGWLG